MENILIHQNKSTNMQIRIISGLSMFFAFIFVLYMGTGAVAFCLSTLLAIMLYEVFKIKTQKSLLIRLIFSFYCMVSMVTMFMIYQKDGPLALLWLIVLVAANDTFALLVGKSIKGPRLCPSISPNKTWSGFLGGFMISSVLSYFLTSIMQLNISIYAIVPLCLASHIGDLIESAFKRYFDIKDSGSIIPGHGGVLDRFDSLLFVNIVYYFIQTL